MDKGHPPGNVSPLVLRSKFVTSLFVCFCPELVVVVVVYLFVVLFVCSNHSAHDAGITSILVAKDSDSSTW